MDKINEYTVKFVDIEIPINAPGHPRESLKAGEILVSEFGLGSRKFACCLSCTVRVGVENGLV